MRYLLSCLMLIGVLVLGMFGSYLLLVLTLGWLVGPGLYPVLALGGVFIGAKLAYTFKDSDWLDNFTFR